MPISSPPAFRPSVPPITLGAAGTVLVSNGLLASTPPTFQAASALIVSGRLLGPPQILTGAGNYNPTAGAVSAIIIAIAAGGGTAGQAASTTALIATARLGAAAGGGSWCQHYLTPLAGPYAFSCGAGGLAGAAGANAGGNGGNTTFGAGPTILTAFGGQGLPSSLAAALSQMGGRGGNLATGGNIYNTVGQNGAFLLGNLGGTNPNISRFMASGGSTPWGSGGRGTECIQGTNVVGEAGQGFGGGAAGSFADDGVNTVAGAAGAQGAILVYEFS